MQEAVLAQIKNLPSTVSGLKIQSGLVFCWVETWVRTGPFVDMGFSCWEGMLWSTHQARGVLESAALGEISILRTCLSCDNVHTLVVINRVTI